MKLKKGMRALSVLLVSMGGVSASNPGIWHQFDSNAAQDKSIPASMNIVWGE
ncbi:hypothetical protein MKMG_02235 [Methanogenium sp. MK-MG]|nr:hypothetical protein MKMG_02235 [Methanogenium sp. MK-MG]